MLTGSELLGLPVLDAATGRRVGRVHDLALAPDATRLAGLVLAPAIWWQGPRLLPWDDVHSAGRSAVLARRGPAAGTVGPRWRELSGKPLVTDRGDELGLLADLWIGRGGTVVGYQLSCGLVEDLLEGQPVLPGPLRLTPGPVSVLVPAAAMNSGGECFELPQLQ